MLGLPTAAVLASLIVVCVIIVATVPTAHAYFLTNYTEYSYANNTLDIHFTDRAHIWKMDMTQVGVFDDDGACAFSFDWKSLNTTNLDRTIITLTLTDAQRITLAGMSDPYVDLRSGSFTPAVGDVPMYPHERKLHLSDTPPYNSTGCATTYGFDKLSLSKYSSYKFRNSTIQAVHDGFAAWSDLNPHLNFTYTNGTDPHIRVEFIDYDLHAIGYACLDCIEDPTLEIVLHSYDCRGLTIYYTPDTIRNTVAHELGHLLGLRHHTDQTHLMFGDDRQLHPYRTDGYIIPDLLPEGFYGEAALIHTLETLPDILDELDAELTKLEARGDKEGNAIYFDSQSLVNKYNKLVDTFVDTYNDYDRAYDRLECMYDTRDPNSLFFNPLEGMQAIPFEP